MTRGYITTIKDLEQAVYGPNGGQYAGRFLGKTDAPIITSTTGWYNATYGKKAWLGINQAANTFAALPKVAWGPESGWTVVSAAPASTAVGVDTDTANLPETVKPTIVNVKAEAKFLPTNWNASIAAQLRSRMQGGSVGDDMAWMREFMANHHASMLNKQLFVNAGTVTNQAVNFESIDRVLSSYSEVNAAYEDGGGSTSYTTSDCDPYDTSLFNRDGGASWVDTYVSHASKGGLRTLTLDLMDTVIENIEKASGERPNVIFTGYDTARKIKGLFEGYWRIPMPQAVMEGSFGGVQGVAGIPTERRIATYDGIPIICDKDCLAETSGISRMYFVNTKYLFLKMQLPTAYFEGGIMQGDPFGLNTFMTEGMYLTGGELVCTNFAAQGKLRDIK